MPEGPTCDRDSPTALEERVATTESAENVVIRFAGDSGDGMQLVGGQFTRTTALFGNDLATFPDFPAEIRAPAGTREGVSGFQIHFADHDIYTPGDETDALVAMNAAALVTNLARLREGALIIVNTDGFGPADLSKARLDSDPLEDAALLAPFRVVKASITTLTRGAVEPLGLSTKEADRCKNLFALGMVYWVYSRPLEPTEAWLGEKFSKKAQILEANLAALRAGRNYAQTLELFQDTYSVPPAKFEKGRYRMITGNRALAIGLATAAQKTGQNLFYGSYPITPASDILHALAPFKNYGVTTFQAEDEIAAVCAAIGASYGGSLGVTGTSGPGVALKGEAIGLAVMAELPLVVICVQRGGPSTGLPTKTEQADLLQALYGRNGEAPVAVIAPTSPADCFMAAVQAVRFAVEGMVPCFLLSDGYIGNGTEPWQLPDLDAIPDIEPGFRTDPEGFEPYMRDPDTLRRPWVVPGTPDMQHRIGGLEKQDGTGNVSYDPTNHQHMCELRAEKVKRLQRLIPPTEIHGDPDGLLVVSWGGTWGAVRSGVDAVRKEGQRIGMIHLRHLNPLPTDLGDILARYDRVLVPELNLGQLARVLRQEFLVDARSFCKIQGQPFLTREVAAAIREEIAR
ncbi:MAG: 2-oxoacid:acceptor oxidoreductase subunit alpha [Myxococcales bacterium]|nr:2-oxoacid:acceptor oxidoreductase subunit alpha [Myxococcales bacterium]MCB9668917.1 2-oxoacid:acceptor oxidoreductase subunit alpha [Alphaproteobacteria bacterium]MCB9691244.1 2-oxoacid:acceptor oxidoreductase subunit alpha [Alphaproteobacteria bacterium]